jgi:hypothetical protein
MPQDNFRTIETPALIVGGGPVGLALAADLGWRGAGFTLVRFGESAPDVSTIARACSERGVPLSVETVGNPALAALYERRLVLVRPDGHVAWRADTPPADPSALVDRVRGASASTS